MDVSWFDRFLVSEQATLIFAVALFVVACLLVAFLDSFSRKRRKAAYRKFMEQPLQQRQPTTTPPNLYNNQTSHKEKLPDTGESGIRIDITGDTVFYGAQFYDKVTLARNIIKNSPTSFLTTLHTNENGTAYNFVTQLNRDEICTGAVFCESGVAKTVFIGSVSLNKIASPLSDLTEDERNKVNEYIQFVKSSKKRR
jgi:hypothetical protein